MVDLVARLRDGAGGDEVGLDEMIEVGLDAASHGDMVDGPAALAQLRSKYSLPNDALETGSRIEPNDNPFEVMRLPNASVRGFKLEMVMAIKEAIRGLDLKQREVAAITGLSQPDVSKLLRGQLSGFTIDRLLEVLIAPGGELEGKVRVPHAKLPKDKPVPIGSAHLMAI